MDTLAYFGGAPECPPGTIGRWPEHGLEELDGLCRVLDSGRWWRGTGNEVEAFEQEFAALQESRYALAVSNGTQAIEIALACLGIGPGDEVIVPAFTFVATATAVLSVGAIPITVDVDPETYCIDLDAIRRAITPATRAVIPVHLAGHACDMDALAALSREHGLAILNDSAHAHGTRWRNTILSKLSVVSAFSFQAGKLLSAGEGGALVTDDAGIWDRAWLKHTYGRPKGDRVYRHLEMGTNARMTEFQAAVLRAQLTRFAQQMAEREEGAARLDALLGELPGIRPARRAPAVTTHSYYMYMITIDENAGIGRDLFVDALAAEGVPAYRAYPAIPDLEMFQQFRRGGPLPPSSAEVVREAIGRHAIPHSRNIARQALWLHHPVLLGGSSTQTRVAAAFRKVLRHRAQLVSATLASGAPA